MIRKISISLWLLFAALTLCSLDAQCIVWYNAENLFRPGVAAGYGVHQYRTKLNHIAKVIASANGFDLPDLVGLCEVENDSVLIDLSKQFPSHPYAFIHYDSPDKRGIDVALLYRPREWTVVNSRPVSVFLDSTTTTRDLLYACLARDSKEREKDTLHLILCHLPSQLGGAAETRWKREKALAVLQSVLDSVQNVHQNAQICVLGDFNEPKRVDLPLTYLKPSCVHPDVLGTHKYHGLWSNLDQVYVSANLADSTTCFIFAPEFLLEEDKKYGGVKPYRTNVFYGARPGYSDHLPIIVKLPICKVAKL